LRVPVGGEEIGIKLEAPPGIAGSESEGEMTGPLHNLKHEHRVIERALRALDGICMRLEWGDQVPYDALSQLVDFIGVFADRYHHGREEECLFPALARKGIPHQDGPLQAMEQQHEIERELTAEMRRAIEGFRDVDPESRRNFVEAAGRYSQHLIRHMEKEESILFRIADEILDDEEKTALAEAFKQAEARLPPHSREEYEGIAARLENDWGI
jgi:hemerythrin-like domain-containing protein